MKMVASRLALAASAASLLISAPASAAAKLSQDAGYSPWASLAATASQSSAQALCGSAGVTAAATIGAAAQPAPGCVLPALDAPVAAPAPQSAAVAPIAPVVTNTAFGVLPLLLGLAALGGFAALLLSGDDNDRIDITQPQPVSP